MLEFKCIHINQTYLHFPLRVSKAILDTDVNYNGLPLCQVLWVSLQQFVRYPSPKCCSTAAMLEFKCVHISQTYWHLPLKLTKEILDADVNYSGILLCQVLRDSLQRFVRYPSTKCCSTAAMLEFKCIHISQTYLHFPLRLKYKIYTQMSTTAVFICAKFNELVFSGSFDILPKNSAV